MNIPNLNEISKSKSSLLKNKDIYKLTEQDLFSVFGHWDKFWTYPSKEEYVNLDGFIEFRSYGTDEIRNEPGNHFVYRRGFRVSTQHLTKQQFDILRQILILEPSKLS